jgi:hypothetical protein
MIPYKLDYTIEKALQNGANAQEKTILARVQDHKWFVSERLGRDVGMLVATLDYFRNIRNLPSSQMTNTMT